jgi:hypothetical protein
MAFESMAVAALPIVTKAHNILAKDEVPRAPGPGLVPGPCRGATPHVARRRVGLRMLPDAVVPLLRAHWERSTRADVAVNAMVLQQRVPVQRCCHRCNGVDSRRSSRRSSSTGTTEPSALTERRSDGALLSLWDLSPALHSQRGRSFEVPS